MERELNSNNTALEKADKGFDEAGDEAKDFSNSVKKAADTSEDADGKLSKLGDTAKKIGAALGAAAAAVGTACVAAGKKLWDMANDVGSAGDQIDKTSQKIGISAESYQKWGYVFERCGADVNNLQTGMKKLSTVITDAAGCSDSAAEKLSAVGLSIEELNGKSQDEQLSMVITALQGMKAGAERTAAANDLLGKSAVDMAAVLNTSVEETERLKQEAEDYGMVMSNEAVAASAAFEDRGILRPAFQMAVDDDILNKNPFGFQLAGVVVNDSVTREAISREDMRRFLKFVHDDNCYCKYYEAIYILFHTGLRISEFCGLTLQDIDLQKKVLNIDHQLQRISDSTYHIEPTKTKAGTRKLPLTDDVVECFRAIIEDREPPKRERIIDGYAGFLYYDKNGMPLVAMHWEHRLKHMVNRYNEIYRLQMPSITPHVCRHTYCSNMARSGMNPKTLQYLMGHSDIGVTLNTYTHLGLEDAQDELGRIAEIENARREMDKLGGEKTQEMFRVMG